MAEKDPVKARAGKLGAAKRWGKHFPQHRDEYLRLRAQLAREHEAAARRETQARLDELLGSAEGWSS